MLKVAPCTVGGTVVQIFSAWWVTTILYNYGATLCELRYNFLLTEYEGRNGEYWPEVVAVWTERSQVRTKKTKGHYSPMQFEQSTLVGKITWLCQLKW